MLRYGNSSVAYINFYRRYTSSLIGKNWVLIQPKQSLFLRENAESLERGRQAHFPRSGSWSERSIRFILLARATSLMIYMNIVTNSYKMWKSWDTITTVKRVSVTIAGKPLYSAWTDTGSCKSTV